MIEISTMPNPWIRGQNNFLWILIEILPAETLTQWVLTNNWFGMNIYWKSALNVLENFWFVIKMNWNIPK